MPGLRGRGHGLAGRGGSSAAGRAKGEQRGFKDPGKLAEKLLELPAGATSDDVDRLLRGESALPSKAWTQVLGALGKKQRADLAVALLAWLRAEGCEVNEYHCSAAISACDKSRQWQAAVGLLQEMLADDSGPQPNAFCYSAAIGACEKGGEWQRAIGLLDGMGAAGVPPSHFCYTAAIRACASARQWQLAMEYFEQMEPNGTVPNVHSYTAAITACHRGAQWQRALSLLQRASLAGAKPDVVAYSAAASACDVAGRWEHALALLGEMDEQGVPPNIVTFNAVLSACEQGGRWEEALALLRDMRKRGVAADVFSCSTAAGACSAAGKVAEASEVLTDAARALPRAESPKQAVDGLALLAKSMEGEAGEADALVAFEARVGGRAWLEGLRGPLELALHAVPGLGARDLGLLAWALGRLRSWPAVGAVLPVGVVLALEQRVLALQDELGWQAIGQLDYGLRALGNGSEGAPVAAACHALTSAGARAAAALAAASARANAAPADLLLALPPGEGPPGPGGGVVLVIDDAEVADGLEARGCEVRRWARFCARSRRGAPWPAAGAECGGGAVLRLSGVQSNFGGAALRLAVAGAASSLPDGAPLWLCGLEEEGVGEASEALQGLFTKTKELACGCGARVLRAHRRGQAPAKQLKDFLGSVTMPLSQVGLEDVAEWQVYPGLFAGGGLDIMTSFLLQRLRRVHIEPGAEILDFCSGSGAIAQAALQMQPQASVYLADADALALEAARANVTGAAGLFLGDAWHAVPPELRFHWVVSNPPVHRRRQDDLTVVEELIAGTKGRLLQPGGRLWIVAQVHVPVGPLLECSGFRARAESDGRFVLWRARLRRGGSSSTLEAMPSTEPALKRGRVDPRRGS